MSSFKEHCLDDSKLKQGVKLPLFNKNGGISDDYVMVRWAWTDEVRAVMDEMKRTLGNNLVQVTPEMTEKQKQSALDKNSKVSSAAILDTRCTQIIGWSFSEKPTKANVRKFLKLRPDVAERIDTASANTKLFFTDSGGIS